MTEPPSSAEMFPVVTILPVTAPREGEKKHALLAAGLEPSRRNSEAALGQN